MSHSTLASPLVETAWVGDPKICFPVCVAERWERTPGGADREGGRRKSTKGDGERARRGTEKERATLGSYPQASVSSPTSWGPGTATSTKPTNCNVQWRLKGGEKKEHLAAFKLKTGVDNELSGEPNSDPRVHVDVSFPCSVFLQQETNDPLYR